MFRISIFFYSNKAFETVRKRKHRIEISLLLGEMKLHKTLNKIWRKKETLKQY
jgi:5,10-methylenetetrahydrofolate reductase